MGDDQHSTKIWAFGWKNQFLQTCRNCSTHGDLESGSLLLTVSFEIHFEKHGGSLIDEGCSNWIIPNAMIVYYNDVHWVAVELDWIQNVLGKQTSSLIDYLGGH